MIYFSKDSVVGFIELAGLIPEAVLGLSTAASHLKGTKWSSCRISTIEKSASAQVEEAKERLFRGQPCHAPGLGLDPLAIAVSP